MLGLPGDYLDTEGGDANRSMSMNAVELLRRLNSVARERGWPLAAYMELVRQGAFRELRAMPPSVLDEPIPPLPGWALEHVAAIERDRLDSIERLGVEVIGDPGCLRLPPDSGGAEDPPAPVRVSMDSAVAFAAGVLERDFVVRRRLRRRLGRRMRRAGR